MLGERSGAEVHVICEGSELTGAIPMRTRHELLRIVGEAVINGIRHGGAREVTVTVARSVGELRLTVADDGCGLPSPLDFDGLKAAGHFGLAGMQERAEALGGELTAGNGERGGATITVRVPVEEAGPRDKSDHSGRRSVQRDRLPAQAAAGGRGLQE
jgi:signal transduction histidine kinase